METINFLGQECYSLENDSLQLQVTRSVGPRILSFGFKGEENLLAELPDVAINHADGVFHFYGGHRLWHAPEEPKRTYLPDDDPVEMTPFEQGIVVTQKTEAQTGIQKTLEIKLSGESAQVVVTHRFTNEGLWPVTCALWAITQVKTGGTAILPQERRDTGVLPNRSLVLWPYTDMKNPNVQWGSRYLLVDAKMQSPFKVGFPNPRGWIAYWRNGIVFVKRAPYDANAEYYDFGSSSQCYCNAQFLELETLAPISTIEPGETVSHVEMWELYRDVERPTNEDEAQSLVDRLGLE